MSLPFKREEFETRRRLALEALRERQLDGILLFKQERCVSWAFVAVPA
jgi:hypothetical protein